MKSQNVCRVRIHGKHFPVFKHILNETWQAKIDSLGTDDLKKEVGSLKEEIDQLKAGKNLASWFVSSLLRIYSTVPVLVV
jgi:hypothetical protein